MRQLSRLSGVVPGGYISRTRDFIWPCGHVSGSVGLRAPERRDTSHCFRAGERTMTKDDTIAAFDPNAAAQTDAGLFGLPFTADQADVIIVPVAWEATVSYGSGASNAPAAIMQASTQVDLHHHDYPDAWKRGLYLDEFPADMAALARRAHVLAQRHSAAIGTNDELQSGARLSRTLAEVNAACARMNKWVYQRCAYWKNRGKTVGLLGGDHSIPLGYLKLHAEQYGRFGILHVDAHHDLRVAYEGFTWSHASIFYNAVSQIPAITRLVQVGIRDYCNQEFDYARSNADRIGVFYERDVRKRLYRGGTWHDVCRDMISKLPKNVHISVDIDGLDPGLCPHTGTPVPGGLAFEELVYLLDELKGSGRSIIGFDLCEVAPGPTDTNGWDANVGARVLFHLCALAGPT